MAAWAFSIATTLILLHRVLADNVTTSFILPDGLFWDGTGSQAFVGQSSVSGSTTSYTIDCGGNDSYFWPGPNGCDGNDSYTYAAVGSKTRFVIPNIDLGENPFGGTAPVATWLQNFTQNMTINCVATTSALDCVYTWLYNEEDDDDKSIISSTIITTATTMTDTSVYPVIWTVPGAAPASAAATPSNAVASSTNAVASSTNNPSPTRSNPSSSTNPTSSSTHPSPIPSSHTLSPGSKAGIGIGVSLGALALTLPLVFFLYRRNRRHSHSRLNTRDGGFVPPGSFEGEVERKNENVVADTSGVHEMEGRKTPENRADGVYEMQGSS